MWRQIWRDLLIESPKLEQPVKVRSKNEQAFWGDMLAILGTMAVAVILLAVGWQLFR